MSSRKSSSIRNSTASTRWGAKVRTISDIDAAKYPSRGTSANGSSFPSSSHFKVQHIPSLPNEEHAAAILRRIQSEFQLIVEKRKYGLTTVTEMCCCEDGLDHLHANKSGGKRGRKTRRMPGNVLGYNLTQGSRNGNSVHRIHLRLRHPKNHTFYSYEEIAGTMCHELAHCEIGPHDAKFYKLMDEIMEQYAVYMAKGLVVDKSGFPMGGENAHKLGGVSTHAGDRNDREKAAQDRIGRQKKMGGTFRLGSILLSGTKASAASLAHLPPAEAARCAAERRIEERRINDSLFCLPCEEIIEILDGASSDEENNNTHNNIARSSKSRGMNRNVQKIASKRKKLKKAKTDEITILDSDDDSPTCIKNRKKSPNEGIAVASAPNVAKDSQIIEISDSSDEDVECSSWSCAKCTYNNDANSLACSICGHESNLTKKKKAKQIQIAARDYASKKSTDEIEKSKRDFGGFNIYGNDKKNSGTMAHLT